VTESSWFSFSCSLAYGRYHQLDGSHLSERKPIKRSLKSRLHETMNALISTVNLKGRGFLKNLLALIPRIFPYRFRLINLSRKPFSRSPLMCWIGQRHSLGACCAVRGFFWASRGKEVDRFPVRNDSQRTRGEHAGAFGRTQREFGGYFRGVLLESMIVGLMTMTGLSLIGVRGALSWGVCPGSLIWCLF